MAERVPHTIVVHSFVIPIPQYVDVDDQPYQRRSECAIEVVSEDGSDIKFLPNTDHPPIRNITDTAAFLALDMCRLQIWHRCCQRVKKSVENFESLPSGKVE